MSLYIYQNSECTTQRVNPDVNYGLWLIIMCQYWLINYNKCTTGMQGINIPTPPKNVFCAFLKDVLKIVSEMLDLN